jgi:hypothetical protein
MTKLNLPDSFFEIDWHRVRPSKADELVAQWRAVGSYAEGSPDPVGEYINSMKQGARASIQEALKQEKELDTEAQMDFFSTQPPENWENVPDTMDQIDEEYKDPLAFLKVQMRKVQGDSVSQDQVDFLAEQAMYGMMIQDTFDPSFGKLAKDFLGLIVWPNESFISARMTDTTWLTSAKGIEQAAFAFYSMPVEDRIASFAMLIDEVKQETPNSIKAMNMLMRIVDPERTAAAGSDLAWDKVGLGGIVFDVATLGATVAFRTINTIRTVGKSLDNADLAADLAALASKSDDVAGALGTDRVSAAAHLQPMAIPEEIIGGAPDSVRRAVAQRTAENQAVVQALREQTLHEGLRYPRR